MASASAKLNSTTDSAEEPTAQAAAQEPVTEPPHEAIAILAYTIWQARGCPEDSAEKDWLEAEEQLRSQSGATTE